MYIKLRILHITQKLHIIAYYAEMCEEQIITQKYLKEYYTEMCVFVSNLRIKLCIAELYDNFTHLGSLK